MCDAIFSGARLRLISVEFSRFAAGSQRTDPARRVAGRIVLLSGVSWWDQGALNRLGSPDI